MYVPMVLTTLVYIIAHPVQVKKSNVLYMQAYQCWKDPNNIAILFLLSTMIPNKENMLLETIACLFLFPHKDFDKVST